MKRKGIAAPLLWPDAIRVSAIIGVVTIHAFSLPTLGNDWRNFEVLFNWFWFIGVKTCVPLFLLLSGALLLGKQEPDVVFYRKRLQRIVLPWLLWGGVFLFYKYPTEISSLTQTLRTFLKILSAEFSFLPALVCLYLLMPFMKVLVRELSVGKRWQLIGLWFVGVSLLPYLRNTLAFPAVVDNGLVRQTISYCGYIFLGYELRLWLEAQKKYVPLLWNAVMVFFLSVTGTFFIQLSHPSTPPLFLSYVAPLIVVSSAAVFCALFAGAQLQISPQVQKIMREFGAASFGVFFLHPLVVLWLTPQIYAVDPTLRNILMTVLTLGMSFLVILLLRLIPWVGKRVS